LYKTAGLLYSRAWMGGGDKTPYQSFVDFPENVLPPDRGFTFFNRPENRLDFNRHNDTGTNYDSRGSANFLYADGHVSMKSDDVLVDRTIGKSTYDSLWSPIDRKAE
jgi:prepilin-type processing-associated H-X9-DG protein